MQKALLSALSGLRVNQQYLDVIGNNLANSSTPGFKRSRVSFAEVLGQTIIPAAGPTTRSGGRNPSQIGSGATVSSINRNFAQGSLLSTGRNLDLGIQGDGFFLMSDGNRDFYTRVGNFGLDADEYLVDLSYGYRLKNVLGNDIQVRLNSVIPAVRTESVEMRGNLPGIVEGPRAEQIASDGTFEDHQPAVLVADNPGPYTLNDGDALVIEVDSGAPQTITIQPGDIAVQGAATAAELAALFSSPTRGIQGVTATDNGGTLELRTTETGTDASIFVTTAATNAVGGALFSSNQGMTLRGTEVTAVATTNLNDLAANTRDYQPGDRIAINGNLKDGSPVTGEFVFGDPAVNPAFHGTDLQAMVDRINTILQSADPVNGATASFDADGTVSIVANSTGEANFSLLLRDVVSTGPVLAGQTNWSSNFFRNVVQGTDPDTASIVTSVFDSTGQAHSLTLDYTRADDGTWTLAASVDPTEGTVVTPAVVGISFDQDGLLNVVPPTAFDIQWTSVPGTQSINIDLGLAGTTEGLTQFGLPNSVIGLADGSTAGALTSVAVRGDGVIEGFYTNGQISNLDQIALVLFSNPTGLNAVGGNLYENSSNSGDPVVLAPQSGPAGSIVAGTIEASNVDVAEEFVGLIEAQRSFQANARMVTTTDEVLAELVNLV